MRVSFGLLALYCFAVSWHKISQKLGIDLPQKFSETDELTWFLSMLFGFLFAGLSVLFHRVRNLTAIVCGGQR